MTREKKEIIKKINQILGGIELDREMGCGCLPSRYEEDLHNDIHKLEEKLAALMHYNSVEDMYHDERGLVKQSIDKLEKTK